MPATPVVNPSHAVGRVANRSSVQAFMGGTVDERVPLGQPY
jgi:hypothetical protein